MIQYIRPGPDPTRRRWWLIVAVLGLLLAVVVVLVGRDMRAIAAASRPPALEEAPRSALPEARRVAQRPAAAAKAPQIITPATPTRRPGPGEAELCGLGIVKTSPADPTGSLQVPSRAWDDARARMLRTMTTHGNERVRAAGLLLAARPPEATPAAASATPDTERLARVAVASDDPVVYALAAEACRLGAEQPLGGACQMLSLARWARLDAGNAVPWLHLAAQARRQGDAGGEAEALYRASTAQRVDPQFGAVAGLALEAVSGAPRSLERTLGTATAASFQTVWLMPAYVDVIGHCSPEAVADANRRQTCEALAALFVDRGRTVLDRRIGIGLGERLGWPGERLLRLRDESDALLAYASEQVRPDDLSCTGVQALADWGALVTHQGELAAARERMAKAPLRPAPIRVVQR